MDDSRGQIILVAALAIAVTFVALALIVNTVIFTENLATRETVSGKEAVLFQQNVADSGEELLERANAYNNSTYDTLATTYRRDIGVLSESQNLHAVTEGSLRDIEVVSIHNGTNISQSTSQNVNDTHDNTSWVAASDVRDTRSFSIYLDTIDVGSDFSVNVSGSGSSWWRMEVEPGSVDISNESGNIGSCSAGDPVFTIGVTNGTVDGTQCDALEFANGVSTPYSISFENGDDVEATYQLVVDEGFDSIVTTDPYTGAASEPKLDHALFNSTLYLEMERSDLTYSSNVTVQPAG